MRKFLWADCFYWTFEQFAWNNFSFYYFFSFNKQNDCSTSASMTIMARLHVQVLCGLSFGHDCFQIKYYFCGTRKRLGKACGEIVKDSSDTTTTHEFVIFYLSCFMALAPSSSVKGALYKQDFWKHYWVSGSYHPSSLLFFVGMLIWFLCHY